MTSRSSQPSRGVQVEFLVCPPRALIEGFAQDPAQMRADLLRAVSRHLARCGPCREETDRLRRAADASMTRRPWIWALASVAVLAAGAAVFVAHELAGLIPGAAIGDAVRPDPRLAALARFDPPAGVLAAAVTKDAVPSPRDGAAAAPAAEDIREMAAARASLDAGRYADAARLLEDLIVRLPGRGATRLLLAYAYAKSGEYERAQRQYAIADEDGAGPEACWGLANASLRLGDLATARRELSEHLLARRPDHEAARELLGRLLASEPRTPR